MSRLLEQAIQQLRELPEYERENAAEAILSYLASEERQHQQGHPTLDRSGVNL